MPMLVGACERCSGRLTEGAAEDGSTVARCLSCGHERVIAPLWSEDEDEDTPTPSRSVAIAAPAPSPQPPRTDPPRVRRAPMPCRRCGKSAVLWNRTPYCSQECRNADWRDGLLQKERSRSAARTAETVVELRRILATIEAELRERQRDCDALQRTIGLLEQRGMEP